MTQMVGCYFSDPGILDGTPQLLSGCCPAIAQYAVDEPFPISINSNLYPAEVLQDLHLWRCLPLTMPSFLHSSLPHFGQVTMATSPVLLIMLLRVYHGYT
jgi:hypothetical protein